MEKKLLRPVPTISPAASVPGSLVGKADSISIRSSLCTRGRVGTSVCDYKTSLSYDASAVTQRERAYIDTQKVTYIYHKTYCFPMVVQRANENAETLPTKSELSVSLGNQRLISLIRPNGLQWEHKLLNKEQKHWKSWK